MAKVVPIYKSGDCKSINNYRPVSVLPVFSKVFERIMYNKTISFLKSFNMSYKYQLGFREQHDFNCVSGLNTQGLDEGKIVLCTL